MPGVFLLTLKETISKKVLLTLFILATIFVLLILFAVNVEIGGVDSKVLLDFFGQSMGSGKGSKFSAEEILGYIQIGIGIAVFFISIFFSLFATAGIFPNFLKKGSVDLILTKPLSRDRIFIERFLGAVTIVGLNIFYTVIFSWIVLSMKFSIWNIRFLLAGIVIFIFFCILFCVLSLVAVLTKNTVISLLIVYFTIFILSPVLAALQKVSIINDTFYSSIIKYLHMILPKVSETTVLIKNIIMSEDLSAAPLLSSALTAFIAFLMALFIFKRTDF